MYEMRLKKWFEIDISGICDYYCFYLFTVLVSLSCIDILMLISDTASITHI